VGTTAGVSREYVSMLESGKNTPTIDVFTRLCHAVKAVPADIMAQLDHASRHRPRR
jgi:transcriptional regulator with XRE-family HTH domain